MGHWWPIQAQGFRYPRWVKKRRIPRNGIAQTVLKLRTQREFSQTVLAVKLQLLGWPEATRDTIKHIEEARRKVSDLEIRILAAALGVNAGRFFE